MIRKPWHEASSKQRDGMENASVDKRGREEKKGEYIKNINRTRRGWREKEKKLSEEDSKSKRREDATVYRPCNLTASAMAADVYSGLYGGRRRATLNTERNRFKFYL